MRVKHQLLILNRGRKRAPNLSAMDRMIAGLCALFMRRTRILRSAIALKPSTLLHLHKAMVSRKYHILFSSKRRRRPGPKGPSQELINAVIEMKRRNPKWGSPRIAQRVTLAFGIEIDKDVVRRTLSVHYHPESKSGGPSWLTILGYWKNICGAATCSAVIRNLASYWVLAVMDQFTRRIVRVGVQHGIVDGTALCRMFNRAIRGQSTPKYLSTDHDPWYRFHQWQANLRVLEISEIKTVPYLPQSHPFVEWLVGTLRREFLDRTVFWTTTDLEAKLLDFQQYYKGHRVHTGRRGRRPQPDASRRQASLSCHQWQKYYRGLYQAEIAA
jgi:putative transposase